MARYSCLEDGASARHCRKASRKLLLIIFSLLFGIHSLMSQQLHMPMITLGNPDEADSQVWHNCIAADIDTASAVKESHYLLPIDLSVLRCQLHVDMPSGAKHLGCFTRPILQAQGDALYRPRRSSGCLLQLRSLACCGHISGNQVGYYAPGGHVACLRLQLAL
jgi:hypothetical protein